MYNIHTYNLKNGHISRKGITKTLLVVVSDESNRLCDKRRVVVQQSQSDICHLPHLLPIKGKNICKMTFNS